jgi:hypothetical protein
LKLLIKDIPVEKSQLKKDGSGRYLIFGVFKPFFLYIPLINGIRKDLHSHI